MYGCVTMPISTELRSKRFRNKMKTRILFLIHDLGQGGAEKVLINLVNNLSRDKFDISVTVLFGGGINEQFLKPDIHCRAVFPRMIPGNSLWMKAMNPEQLHQLCVKERYDIEVSYLEGPSARVISGCRDLNTKLVCWIHSNPLSVKDLASPFRSDKEAKTCYSRFEKIVCVSQTIKESMEPMLPLDGTYTVLYNTVEFSKIREMSEEEVPELEGESALKLVAVGTLKEIKGFDRLLRVVKRLIEEKNPVHLFLLGDGPDAEQLRRYVMENSLQSSVSFLGYQLNPYKYVAKCDLFVCSSYSEGFSTAATEALIVGTPVCTVAVSGMKEMLGENNEYGIITENDEEALYQGIKRFVESPETLEYYKKKARERGERFSTKNTVRAVEEMLLSL